MNKRWLNIAIAILFLVVGILATASTIRLNNYIKETLPRDDAQERCNTETIAVLKTWVEARASRDGAMDARDEAAIIVLDQLSNGQYPASDEALERWRDAVANDRLVRAEVNEARVPIPDC